MKRLVFIALAALSLAGCTQIFQTEKKLWVYDSYWHLVMQSKGASKDAVLIDSGDIQAQVDAYNAAHIGSQLFVESEETPIEQSPPATVYIVKPDTHDILKAFVSVERQSFTENATSWDLEARADGGTMYVDNIPPAPIPQDATYKYYIYLIGADGTVLYSVQTTPELFTVTLQSYYLEAYNHPGSHVLSGQLYQP